MIVKVIAEVIAFSNGMVMVFDLGGEQMSEYQGRISEVRKKILDAAGPEVEFRRGKWKGEVKAMSREEFELMPDLYPGDPVNPKIATRFVIVMLEGHESPLIDSLASTLADEIESMWEFMEAIIPEDRRPKMTIRQGREGKG